jgi:hypothetical protein
VKTPFEQALEDVRAGRLTQYAASKRHKVDQGRLSRHLRADLGLRTTDKMPICPHCAQPMPMKALAI